MTSILTWSMATWETLVSFFYVTSLTMANNTSSYSIVLLQNFEITTVRNYQQMQFIFMYNNKSNSHKSTVSDSNWGYWQIPVKDIIITERKLSSKYHTSFPSGKQRQKKSGRGRPVASFIASVIIAVISTANRRPAFINQYEQLFSTYVSFRYTDSKHRCKKFGENSMTKAEKSIIT